jgi:hypothetical protein
MAILQHNPNNRCIWDIPSFTVKDNIPDWKVQTNEWNVEDSRAWRTEDTDRFFYEIEEKKMIRAFIRKWIVRPLRNLKRKIWK